jgi:hypothetical protein
MPAALYMDVHVPKAVTNQLRRRGVDVLTAQEDQTTLLNDERLLERWSICNRIRPRRSRRRRVNLGTTRSQRRMRIERQLVAFREEKQSRSIPRTKYAGFAGEVWDKVI